MFPLQGSCELSFQLLSDSDHKDGHSHPNPQQQQYLFVSDIPHPELLGSPNPVNNIADDDDTANGILCRRRRRISNHCGAGDYGDSKRIIHRETERQRRLEMATHFTTLKNLLPHNYIKGKRSMSDHVMEAGKYIKELEMRIKEMKSKRAKLKGTEDPLNAMNIMSESHVVSVERCSLGLEIKLVSSGSNEEAPLSKLLTVVMQQGLDVVNCVSTKVRRRFIHVIHAEVNDVSSIDPSWLQRRLHHEICQYHN